MTAENDSTSDRVVSPEKNEFDHHPKVLLRTFIATIGIGFIYIAGAIGGIFLVWGEESFIALTFTIIGTILITKSLMGLTGRKK